MASSIKTIMLVIMFIIVTILYTAYFTYIQLEPREAYWKGYWNALNNNLLTIFACTVFAAVLWGAIFNFPQVVGLCFFFTPMLMYTFYNEYSFLPRYSYLTDPSTNILLICVAIFFFAFGFWLLNMF